MGTYVKIVKVQLKLKLPRCGQECNKAEECQGDILFLTMLDLNQMYVRIFLSEHVSHCDKV